MTSRLGSGPQARFGRNLVEFNLAVCLSDSYSANLNSPPQFSNHIVWMFQARTQPFREGVLLVEVQEFFQGEQGGIHPPLALACTPLGVLRILYYM